MSPTFNGSDIPEKYEIIKAISGKIISCDNNPTTRGRGKSTRFLKLSVVNESPTPSIINASVRLSRISSRVYAERTIQNKYNHLNQYKPDSSLNQI